MSDKTIKGYTYFDYRCFPIPDKMFCDLSWRSGVLESYEFLIHTTNKDNAYVKRKIKEALLTDTKEQEK